MSARGADGADIEKTVEVLAQARVGREETTAEGVLAALEEEGDEEGELQE